MDLSTTVLLAVVALLAINQLFLRVVVGWRWRAPFYVVQGLNLVAGTAIAAIGLPGFEHMRVVSWFVALLFFWKVVQNNRARIVWLEALRAEARDEEREKQAALLGALRGADEG